MNKNDDTTDQMLLLLALIKEQREAIGDDRQKVEQFYTDIQNGILERAEKSFYSTNQKANEALQNRIDQLDQAIKSLNNRFILIYSTTFVTLVMVFFFAIFLYVPSKDEIHQRRADIAVLKKYPLQIKESDGETLVRIMTKTCYSFEPNDVKEKTFDWCKIDPKKY